MVQLLAGIISLRRVLEANPGRSHGSADTLPLRHSANYTQMYTRELWVSVSGSILKPFSNRVTNQIGAPFVVFYNLPVFCTELHIWAGAFTQGDVLMQHGGTIVTWPFTLSCSGAVATLFFWRKTLCIGVSSGGQQLHKPTGWLVPERPQQRR